MSYAQFEYIIVRLFAGAMLLFAAVHTYKVVTAVRARAAHVAAVLP